MMSRRVKRHASGGRIGQHHRKTPLGLRSYNVPPAGPVTMTRTDGSTEVQAAVPAQRSKSVPPQKVRRRANQRRDDPVPIERVRAVDAGSMADRDERNQRDAASLAALGQRVLPPVAATTRRRLRVDNGTGTLGDTGLPLGKWIRRDKETAASRLTMAQLGDELHRPCVGCRARVGERCRNPDGTPRDRSHTRR